MERNQNDTAPTASGFKDVTIQYNDAKAQKKEVPDIAANNRRREIVFKAHHLLLIGFFLWIAYVGAYIGWKSPNPS